MSWSTEYSWNSEDGLEDVKRELGTKPYQVRWEPTRRIVEAVGEDPAALREVWQESLANGTAKHYDMRMPIIVGRSPSGQLYVIDGNHRLARAVGTGQSRILVAWYLVPTGGTPPKTQPRVTDE